MTDRDRINGYSIEVKPVPSEYGGGSEALFPQLARGVVGYGDTPQKAVDDLFDAVPAFLEAVSESGQELPAAVGPKGWEDYSGKFNVRVPKLLHAKLARLAEEQSVSLNALVQSILMAGATALEAGHEFGSVPPGSTEAASEHTWPRRIGAAG